MEPTAAFDEWLDALRVRPVAPGRFRAFGSPGRRTRIFGGLVMGQALAAAAHDVDSTRLTPLSVHCDFVRAGDPHAAVDLEVTATSDGRTFATRTVVARQADRVLITMLARFHVAEPGAELQALTPRPAPPPEGLVTFSAHLAPHAARAPDWADGNLPVDVRVVDEAGPSRPLQRSWLRVGDAAWQHEPGQDPPTPVLVACGLLYGSDMALIGTAPAAFGRSWTDDGVQLATRRPRRVVPPPAGARRVVAVRAASCRRSPADGPSPTVGCTPQTGRIVASVAQQALFRLPTRG